MSAQNRVTVKATESAELVISITDKMIDDYGECKGLSEKRDCDGKDCSTCSLDTAGDFNFGLCELPAVAEIIEERCGHEQTKV